MLHTKYQSSKPSSFIREDFQRFFPLFVTMATRVMGGTKFFWTPFVELYPNNIPVKFHHDCPSGLGEDF